MLIRRYDPKDGPETALLFYRTVHTVNARDYTAEQLQAWAPEVPALEKWNRSLREHVAFVAVEEGALAGFGDIDPQTGYLDRLYVHCAMQGRGIGSALCDRLEAAAQTETIVTHASLTARAFFANRGYQVLREQRVERRGILLKNFVMMKRITG